MRVGVIGRTETLFNTILLMQQSGHEIVFIITCTAAPEYTRDENDFRKLAQQLAIPFKCTQSINSLEIIDFIKKHRPDMSVSINWQTVISRDVINCFPHGIVNAHLGDLPKYRGNATANWAIIAGEEKIVLTFHLMDEGLDNGPILHQTEFPIDDKTCIGHIYDFFTSKAPHIFLHIVDDLEAGNIVLTAQPKNPSLALRCYPRIPSDSEINWNENAITIDRLIRASAEPFSGAYTFLESKKVTIWRARPEQLTTPYMGIPGSIAEIRKNQDEVVVITGNGFIILEEIEMETSGRLKAAKLINSMRIRLGLNLSMEILKLINRTSH